MEVVHRLRIHILIPLMELRCLPVLSRLKIRKFICGIGKIIAVIHIMTHGIDLIGHILAYVADDIEPAEPDWTTRFMPDAGHAVFQRLV